MSDNKKYYYLKLKDNFYDRPEIKAIESMESGYEYISIMQKMYLRSLERDGKLMITDTIPYDLKTLGKVLGHKQETINTAINLFKEFGLLKIMDDKSIYMIEIQSFIGHSSTEADRIRKYRETIKSVQIPYKCTPELELKLEKELKKKKDIKNKIYGNNNNIKLTDNEYNKLLEKLSNKENLTFVINYLSDYKVEKGYSTKSDYLTILRWVIGACEKKINKTENVNDKNKIMEALND